MTRQDLFTHLRTALETREETALLQIPADRAVARFLAHAQPDLVHLIRVLSNILEKSGIPATPVVELDGLTPFVALALDDARSRGVFLSPHDASSLVITVRGCEMPFSEEIRAVQYRYCTVRGFERILDDAIRPLILVPPL
jgi:hypothetical protein